MRFPQQTENRILILTLLCFLFVIMRICTWGFSLIFVALWSSVWWFYLAFESLNRVSFCTHFSTVNLEFIWTHAAPPPVCSDLCFDSSWRGCLHIRVSFELLLLNVCVCFPLRVCVKIYKGCDSLPVFTEVWWLFSEVQTSLLKCHSRAQWLSEHFKSDTKTSGTYENRGVPTKRTARALNQNQYFAYYVTFLPPFLFQPVLFVFCLPARLCQLLSLTQHPPESSSCTTPVHLSTGLFC